MNIIETMAEALRMAQAGTGDWRAAIDDALDSYETLDLAIIITGDPASGLQFTGPFDNTDAAIEYAEEHCEQWWIGELELATRWNTP